MEEQLWNTRPTHLEHLQRFDHQKSLHAFSRAIGATQENPPDDLSILNDDTSTTEVLDRLELASLRELARWASRTQGNPQGEMKDSLQQAALAGTQAARAIKVHSFEAGYDLRKLLYKLSQSPFLGRSGMEHFLVRRASPDALTFSLLHCPHRWSHLQRDLPAITPEAADTLCNHWIEWQKGFIQHLMPQVQIELQRQPSYCWITWKNSTED